MRKFKLGTILIGTILMISTNSYAYTVDLSVNENKIVAGSKVVVSVNLKDLEEEIDVYKGQLDYDKNSFNEITEEDFLMKNGWTGLVFNKETGVFVIENDKKLDKSHEVFQITLESKKNIDKENISLNIINNFVSGGNKDIKSENVELKIGIIEENINYGYPVKDKIITRIKPKTNVEDFKNTIENYSNCSVKVLLDNKEIDSGFMKTGMKVEIVNSEKNIQFVVSVIGDINGDGIANTLDSQIIKAYRNEIINLTKEEICSADIDNNDVVDIKDTKLLLYHRADVKGYNLNYAK